LLKILRVLPGGKSAKVLISNLQHTLADCGFYAGLLDGDLGPQTLVAWKAFVSTKAQLALYLDYEFSSAGHTTGILPRQWTIPPIQAFVSSLFNKPKYRDVVGGYVQWEGNWEEENIIPVQHGDLSVLCNKYIVEKVSCVLTDLSKVEENLLILSYCPRHILHKQDRGLSMHSYGLAFDVNPSTNAYGTRGNISSVIVDIFESHGFTWGGRWGTSDPMHFQYADIL